MCVFVFCQDFVLKIIFSFHIDQFVFSRSMTSTSPHGLRKANKFSQWNTILYTRVFGIFNRLILWPFNVQEIAHLNSDYPKLIIIFSCTQTNSGLCNSCRERFITTAAKVHFLKLRWSKQIHQHTCAVSQFVLLASYTFDTPAQMCAPCTAVVHIYTYLRSISQYVNFVNRLSYWQTRMTFIFSATAT